MRRNVWSLYNAQAQIFQPVQSEQSISTERARPLLNTNISREIAETIRLFRNCVALFGGLTLTIVGLGQFIETPLDLVQALQLASGLTGMGMALRTIGMSRTILFWGEVLFGKDFNQDGYIGLPLENDDPEPDLAGSSEANDTYLQARALFRYSLSVIAKANKDGIRLSRKPFARREAERKGIVSQEQWQKVMQLWCEGGIINNRNDKSLNLHTWPDGTAALRSAMINRGYIELNHGGKSTGIWIMRQSSPPLTAV